MAIYHQITWNYSADPTAITDCTAVIDDYLQPYFSNGSTNPADNYYEPPVGPNKPQPTSGTYARIRMWGDMANCEAFVNQVNSWRNNDPIAPTVISEATIFTT